MSRSPTSQIDLEQSLKVISPDLWKRLNGVKDAVEKVWKKPYLHWYTDHGPQHSRRVIGLIGQILCPLCLDYLSRHENDFPLSDYELYILLAACYLHDIGMQDLKVDERPVDELGPSDWEEIRKRHPQRSLEIILDRTIKPRHRRNIGLGLNESDKDDSLMPIALVSMAHGSEYFEPTVSKLQENLYHPAGKPIRGDLLAALLMMGDEIDLHKSRANLPDDSRAFSPLSLLHNYKQTYVSSIAVQDGRTRLDRQIAVGFLFPPQARDGYGRDLEAWVVNKIEEQVNRTQDILLSATKGQLRWDEKPVVARIRYDEYGEREALPLEVWEVLKGQTKEVPDGITVNKNGEEREEQATGAKPLPDTARPMQVERPDILANELLPKAALKGGYLQIEGQVVRIEKSEVLIGRSRNCDISLSSPSYYKVSSRHARVIWRGKEGFIILDGDGIKASRFGTFVNGKKVDSVSGAVLRDGDYIVLGGLKSSIDTVAESDRSSEDIARLKELLDILRKNLYEFEGRKAKYSLNPPTEIIHGIEHEREEISRLEQELVKQEVLARIARAPEGACVLLFKSEGSRTA